MNAYECDGKFLKEGYIDVPGDIKKRLKSDQNIKLIIMVENEEKTEKRIAEKLTAAKNLQGLLAGVQEDKIKEFDKIIKARINFRQEDLKL